MGRAQNSIPRRPRLACRRRPQDRVQFGAPSEERQPVESGEPLPPPPPSPLPPPPPPPSGPTQKLPSGPQAREGPRDAIVFAATAVTIDSGPRWPPESPSYHDSSGLLAGSASRPPVVFEELISVFEQAARGARSEAVLRGEERSPQQEVTENAQAEVARTGGRPSAAASKSAPRWP